jgi:cytidine deaminase
MKKEKLTITKEESEKLIAKAKEGMTNAYSIVNNFSTGAAILTENGNIYAGCNVESVISGLGICAERNAINHAVVHGEYKFKAIVIISKSKEPVKPCGMCLQYIGEFAQVNNKDIIILMAGSNGKINQSSIEKMLPETYGPRDSNKDISKYQK